MSTGCRDFPTSPLVAVCPSPPSVHKPSYMFLCCNFQGGGAKHSCIWLCGEEFDDDDDDDTAAIRAHERECKRNPYATRKPKREGNANDDSNSSNSRRQRRGGRGGGTDRRWDRNTREGDSWATSYDDILRDTLPESR